MAKKEKWEKLADYVRSNLQPLYAVTNHTAEQCGMIEAYAKVLIAMSDFERLEKKLDKA